MASSIEVNEPDQFESLQPESRLTVFRLILRHYLLVVLGAVVGCIIGALYYARATPIYESKAQILVVNKSRNNLPGTEANSPAAMDTSATEDYLATHQTLIHSPAIVGAAVRQSNLGNLASFAGGGEPSGTILNSLKVWQEVVSGKPTSVLNISFRSPHAEDLPAVITAVIDSYQKFLKRKYQNVTNEAADLIVEANRTLKENLNKKQEEYDKFLADLPTSLWKGKEGFSSVQVQLMSLEAKRVELLNREADLQGRLQALDRALIEGRYTRSQLLTMLAREQGASGGSGSKENMSFLTTDRLVALEIQEKKMSEDYGPDHPEVREVRDQLDMFRARVKRLGKVSETDVDAGTDAVGSHIQALKLELEYTRTAAETMSKVLEDAHKKAKPLRRLEIKNESFLADIARSERLFDAIAKRLDEMSILKNANGGFEAEIISEPGVGGKVAPRALFVFAIALALGLFAGLGLAYLAEISDHSFRTPEEIRRRLGLPLVGHIPFFEPEDKEKAALAGGPQVSPSLCTVYRPKSREAEAYRGVRTALFFSGGGSHSLIQVTSPDKGDGKSTLIGNLAVSMAQAEKKVILIDADLRRPRAHKLFNLSNEQGLTSVITGETEVEDVIQTTPVPGLFILPSGPIPPNPAELLTLPRFKEMLAYLREKYDFVLVDTPPLLAVTDPCVVAPYVDGVILTIRISKNARPNALRAKEILSTLGSHVIGVVVNGLGLETHGYSYGGYRYGYNSYRYYNYSTYESDEPASSDNGAGGDVPVNGAADAPEKQPVASRRSSRKKTGLFAWLFDR